MICQKLNCQDLTAESSLFLKLLCIFACQREGRLFRWQDDKHMTTQEVDSMASSRDPMNTGSQALDPPTAGRGAGAVGSLELLFSCNRCRASPRRLSTSVRALPPKLAAACLWSEPPIGRWLPRWCCDRKWPYVPPPCNHLWPKAIASWPDPGFKLLAGYSDSARWIPSPHSLSHMVPMTVSSKPHCMWR